MNKGKKKKSGTRRGNGSQKKGVKEKISEILELPKELILDIPKLTIIGNKDIMVENYKNIMEYDSTRIRVSTGAGVIKITGAGLLIKEITIESIIISGTIHSLEFI